MIGVAGGSGSGKTTIVRKMQELCPKVGMLVFQLDHYYRDLAHLDPQERDRVNFDHPNALEMELIAQHVGQLARGEAIDRPTYEFASHTRSSKVVHMEPHDVILVDGIFALYHPEIRRHLDCAIYVDVSDDVRFIRRLKRDVEERGRTNDGVIKQYLSSVKPMHDQYVAPTKLLADMVIHWDHFNDRTLSFLANMIEQSIRSKNNGSQA